MNLTVQSEQPKLLEFAASEFRRLAGRMERAPTGSASSLTLGLFSDFSLPDPGVDAIRVETRGLSGLLAGTSPGMALFAVYRYFEACGARWLFPGREGEYLPKTDFAASEVHLDERASYAHRGICIEGAVSFENVRDMVDWASRLGFNEYFLQFRTGFIFFDRWYSHRKNPLLPPRPFDAQDARSLTEELTGEIKRRGLRLQACGHGWTCEPFGIEGLGWDPQNYRLTDGQKRHFALVDGVRDIWKGVALDTNLCYSNRETRRLVQEDICRYLEAHPAVDQLHVWLSDGQNNVCECESCQEAPPSDFYVLLLNELDEQMTARGLRQKIVFLIYMDLLWPPVRTRLKNPDRFLLMFAPITRTYSSPFRPEAPCLPPPPYRRNRLTFPQSVSDNLAFLRQWQRQFPGDSFLFDYHLMWDHLKDLSYESVSRVLWEDLRALEELGLNGYVSCQTQRCSFPNALPLTVLGKTLWNRELPFETIRQTYFEDCYGPNWEVASIYLNRLSRLLHPSVLRRETPLPAAEAAGDFRKIPALVESLRPALENAAARAEEGARRIAWERLLWHSRLLSLLAPALSAFAEGERGACVSRFETFRRAVQEHELELQPCLDVFELLLTYEKLLEVTPE